MYWDKEHECMPLEEMQKFQLKGLKETVKWVYEKVPFYKNTFQDMGLEPGDIKSLDDLAKLRFTVKTDLRDNYPFSPVSATHPVAAAGMKVRGLELFLWRFPLRPY